VPNLAPILSGVADRDEIVRQYDEMVKYAAAMQHGVADPESILRRFFRGDVMRPTYNVLAELGRAIKTIFLCYYLELESFRREIHEGLNVIENWSSANGFVFFGKGVEIATNRAGDQKIVALSLQLVQTCLSTSTRAWRNRSSLTRVGKAGYRRKTCAGSRHCFTCTSIPTVASSLISMSASTSNGGLHDRHFGHTHDDRPDEQWIVALSVFIQGHFQFNAQKTLKAYPN